MITNYVNNATLISNNLPEPLIQFNPSFQKKKNL
jgi:hypothetical protein